jgi:ribosomal protein S18 acetylase RimI-like enzyme
MATMSDPVEVVTATPTHAAIVEMLVRELAAQQGATDGVTTTVGRWRELLADDGIDVLIALDRGEPVGYVSGARRLHLWTGREIMAIDDIYVRPAARGRGIGTELMRSMSERQVGRPLRWEMDEANLPGQAFSLDLGARLRRRVIAWSRPPHS